MRSLRTATSRLLSLLIAGLALAGTTGSARAAEVFRFWMYSSVVDGEVKIYDKGPGVTNPADGSVEAYRYGGSVDFPPHVNPRADLDELTFEAICGEIEPVDGQKRVAVLVDFGVEEDAPDGQEPPAPFADCAQVPMDATGLQTLDAVADVRTEKSSAGPSLCGIDGYPAAGPCFATATAPSPDDAEPLDFTIRSAAGDDAADETGGEDSNMPLLLGVGAAVVAIAAGGLLLSRRNKSA
jgi:LPXTG-motif cell wall-anchored protein